VDVRNAATILTTSFGIRDVVTIVAMGWQTSQDTESNDERQHRRSTTSSSSIFARGRQGMVGPAGQAHSRQTAWLLRPRARWLL
jgi:hypothetical protein